MLISLARFIFSFKLNSPQEIKSFSTQLYNKHSDQLVSPLWHGRNPDKSFNKVFDYRTIQYKYIQNKFSIVAINQAINVVQNELLSNAIAVNYKHKTYHLAEPQVIQEDFNLLLQDNLFDYEMANYLPYNSEDVDLLRKLANEPLLRGVRHASVAEAAVLEYRIKEHITTLLRDIGGGEPNKLIYVKLHPEINLKLTDLYINKNKTKVKQKFYSYQLRFSTNALLPPDIGLGQQVAIGFGSLIPIIT